MRKITDLRGIKDTAKVFLHMNIEKTKFSPLVIKHPFTDSAMVCLSQTDGEIAFANIMEDTKAFTLWKEQVEKQIDTAEDVCLGISPHDKILSACFFKIYGIILVQRGFFQNACRHLDSDRST